ncbi:Uncharacterised protein [Mycobacteroides abscessus subsp. abscessus]|nr:Uncharacterised protein [Mycobacteroides abscessus subsp. abscessus]
MRASATSRSNSSGVSEICSPSRVTLCAGTSMSIPAMFNSSAGSSSFRRSRARMRATSSLGLNGFMM